MTDAPDPAATWTLGLVFSDESAWWDEFHRCRDRLREFAGEDSDSPVSPVPVTTESGESTAATALDTVDGLVCRVERLLLFARLSREQSDVAEDWTDALSAARSLYTEAKTATCSLRAVVRSGDSDLPETFAVYDAVAATDTGTVCGPEAARAVQTLAERRSPAARTYDARVKPDLDYDPPTVTGPTGDRVEIAKRRNRARIMKTADRETRRTTHESFVAALAESRHTLARAYVDSVERAVSVADLRSYDDPLDGALRQPTASLVGPRSTVGRETFDTLLSAVESHVHVLGDDLRQKRATLGYEEIRPWDLRVPYETAYTEQLSRSTIRAFVVDSLAPLGTAYCDRVRRLFEEGRVRVQNRPSTYQFGSPRTGPFVAFGYGEEFRDFVLPTFLLAHQLGHAVSQSLAREQSESHLGQPPRQLAEIASSVHEFLLVDHLTEPSRPDALRARAAQVGLERLRQSTFLSAEPLRFTQRVFDEVAAGRKPDAAWLDDTYREIVETYAEPVERTPEGRSQWTTWKHHDDHVAPFDELLGTTVAAGLLSDGVARACYEQILRAGSREPTGALLDAARAEIDGDDLGCRAATDRYEQLLATLRDTGRAKPPD